MIEFKEPPRPLFAEAGTPTPHPNHLRLRLGGGAEGIELSLEAKVPGETMETRPVPLAFSYEQSLGDQAEAYERLLFDAIDGRQALFARQDGVEECWRIVEPVLRDHRPSHPYASGSWGPAAADDLIGPVGAWHAPEAARDRGPRTRRLPVRRRQHAAGQRSRPARPLEAAIDRAVGADAGSRSSGRLYEETDATATTSTSRTPSSGSRASSRRRPGYAMLADAVLSYPYAQAALPGAHEVLRHVQPASGPTAILSDGDPVFQPAKIARAGFAADVDGRVFVFAHKEDHLDGDRTPDPGRTLRPRR